GSSYGWKPYDRPEVADLTLHYEGGRCDGRERLRNDAALSDFVEELRNGTCPTERLRMEFDEVIERPSMSLFTRIEELQGDPSMVKSLGPVYNTSPQTPRNDRSEPHEGTLEKTADGF
ncbi:hypothetical protein FOZ62_013814, partial [Perkinsus olseni]